MKKLILGLAAAAALTVVAAPVMAATQWNFGGSLQYKTFWTERDYGWYGGDDLQGGGAGLDNDGILDWGTQGDSNISMTMVSDHLTGYIRPLAKLRLPFKITNTGNEIKSQAKALSAVTITFG